MRRVRLKVKEVAEQKHISLNKLHMRTEIAHSTIRRIFQDPYTEIKLGTLARIADVLNCSICDLFIEEQEESPDQ